MALATAIVLVARTGSYPWLPEGLLRGRSAAAVVAGQGSAGSWLREWLLLAAVNLRVLVFVYVAPNLPRLPGGIPLSYLPVGTMRAYFGVATAGCRPRAPRDALLRSPCALPGIVRASSRSR